MVNIKAFYGKKEYTPFSTDHSRILYNTTFFLPLHTNAWFRCAQKYVCPMYDSWCAFRHLQSSFLTIHDFPDWYETNNTMKHEYVTSTQKLIH